MSLVDSNANYVAAALDKARFFRGAGHLFHATPASLPTWCCRRARAWKKKAPSPARSGASSGSTRCSSRWETAGRTGGSSRTSPIAWGRTGTTSIPPRLCDEIASLTPMFAGVTYERLEGYQSLQWPVAADGTDQPLLYTKRFQFPGRQGAAVIRWRWTEPDRAAGRGVRSAFEQRPAARTLPRRQSDLPQPRASAKRRPTRSSKFRRNSQPSAGSRAGAGCN